MKKEMGFDEFLKHSAAYFGLQWRLFRRRGIKRKVDRRMSEMGYSDYETYWQKVKTDPDEKAHLSKILTITISRFFRDREVFETLETKLLPVILQNRGEGELKIWSIGCASGEEPYSLSLLWKDRFEKKWPGVRISILATDLNEDLIERAKGGRYRYSSLREVNEERIQRYFRREGDFYILNQEIKEEIKF
ncbi:MAG: CheR family methyltransferase, partial [Thermodesulfobacteriota bacterium]